MKEYDIIITPEAENDLDELDDYITFELHAPETALRFINDIEEEIYSLRKHAKLNSLVSYEPWHSRGYRRMNFKGYAVHYVLVEDDDTVYIQNIIYQKRNMPKVLADRYGE